MQRSLEFQPNPQVNSFREVANNIYELTLENQRTKSRIANEIRKQIGNAVSAMVKGVLPGRIDVADVTGYLGDDDHGNKVNVEYNTRTNSLNLVRITINGGNRTTAALETLGDDAWIKYGGDLAHILEVFANMHQPAKKQ